MAARGRKFSFFRLINNAIPNFARDDPNDVNLSPSQADALFSYQLALPHPRYLGDEAFAVAGIVGSKILSRKVLGTLVKNGTVVPAPGGEDGREGGEVQMTVNTAAITKNFAHQLASISVHAQRKLVGLLFFWEEECTRWMLLDGEEGEIGGLLEVHGESTDLTVALEAVRLKMVLMPSQRAEGTANVGAGVGHVLPSYV
ncbi:hypothetical protein IFR05_013747 [Cadophora sp. M221]|nr:hypothetical protein IFR05_013747 [Cadophora sp. M221]